MKKNIKKIACSKNNVEITWYNFFMLVFFVWMITRMLIWNAYKPWNVFFVTIFQFCFVTLKLKQRKV
jgi:hypothetical protein